MLRRTLFAITMFSVLPAIGTVSQAVAADRGLCFKEQKAVIEETCYNPLPRRTFQFGGQQNGAGQPHDFPGGHGGKFPVAMTVSSTARKAATIRAAAVVAPSQVDQLRSR